MGYFEKLDHFKENSFDNLDKFMLQPPNCFNAFRNTTKNPTKTLGSYFIKFLVKQIILTFTILLPILSKVCDTFIVQFTKG